MLFAFLMPLFSLSAVSVLQQWNFSDPEVCNAWEANTHIENIQCADGMLQGKTVSWDPFFRCSALAIPALSGQYIRLRMKADVSGRGQLFWTGASDGQYGGFEERKSTHFQIPVTDGLEDIYLFPFWQTEGTIRQLRLDLYDGLQFGIAEIAVLENLQSAPLPEDTAWAFTDSGEAPGWLTLNRASLLVSPPLEIATDKMKWVILEASARRDCALDLFWSTDTIAGAQKETVYLRHNDGAARRYYIHPADSRFWQGKLIGLYLSIPPNSSISIRSISLSPEADGPPELELTYFGFEDAVSRAGRPEKVLAQFTNAGGGEAVIENVRLDTSEGMRVRGSVSSDATPLLRHGETCEIHGTVISDEAGDKTLSLFWNNDTGTAGTVLSFAPALKETAAYVPQPVPVETTRSILAYYFPGWEKNSKWDCIRKTAPVRKPLLGYYDESRVECVDWQIKWAVENGISCFLVDWYWCQGREHLKHWFEAYRNAKYRDYLQVAIMWANHNPPNTHSREDWRAVTQEWIDHYFTLDSYYRIKGKPAVFIWNAEGIRHDLGGSRDSAAALAESQDMARAAGFEGIEFVSIQLGAMRHEVDMLKAEGYGGHTSYHEWGNALELASSPALARFSDLVASGPIYWEKRRALSDGIDYYPLVETGWDSRPWHGNSATVFHGRTVEGFTALLKAARDYCDRHNQNTIILGPVNEWGEGSYIEPCLEYGFSMYEAIRACFGKGDPASWPQNKGPRDMSLGPYDYTASDASD